MVESILKGEQIFEYVNRPVKLSVNVCVLI